MVPESVIKKMTKEEKLYYIAALEDNNKVLKKKEETIENLYAENQMLKQELEELKSTHPGYQIQEMKEMADYAVKHKEEILLNPRKSEMLASILQIATDNDLEDEEIKDLVFNALSMANKFRLQNKLEGTDSETNVIIP